jgi:hypothetical protein
VSTPTNAVASGLHFYLLNPLCREVKALQTSLKAEQENLCIIIIDLCVLDLCGVDLVMLHFLYAFGSIFSVFEFHQYDSMWMIFTDLNKNMSVAFFGPKCLFL